MENYDITKFEFVLTLENNIVIQRYFNVMGYNPQAKKSIELYEYVSDICDEISRDLKWKTLDFMNDNPNIFIDWDSETPMISRDQDLKEEYFLVEIKMGNEVFMSRQFPAHIYHPKVRYTVDVRPKIRRYLEEISTALSLESPTMKYMEYELS